MLLHHIRSPLLRYDAGRRGAMEGRATDDPPPRRSHASRRVLLPLHTRLLRQVEGQVRLQGPFFPSLPLSPSPPPPPTRFGILSNILLGEDKDALQAMSCGQNESISDNPVGLFHPHQPIHSPCAQCAQRNGTELTGLQPVITGVRNIPGGFRARAAL